ncbi:hypothetical protein SAMN05444817_101369 [Corynebacterium appendicis CIP 107643]|uniref:Uncharacterized protein n=1 Tax=Corynebacterium appendicis CIP 107643 TaxID=1161099 RepID=A0A1N7IRH1_9CORY|nr:hypothetical protein [Corynebacterium appendicis]WJY62051.1 hypothetical protein CAPP_10835 [Corynebacterium appendicis CIP 107643]SIS39596.1 hypothetical protein SAMN05444817_101369 [Corynebacterium appendicis CIP 107643]
MNASLLGYFRHQFFAAPLTRLIWMIPILAMLAFGLLYVVRDSAVGVIFGPMMLTVFMIGALSLEDTAYTAYGLPSPGPKNSLPWRLFPLWCSARALR